MFFIFIQNCNYRVGHVFGLTQQDLLALTFSTGIVVHKPVPSPGRWVSFTLNHLVLRFKKMSNRGFRKKLGEIFIF